MKKVFELNFRGRKLVVEHGELAKQAAGAVLVRYGDTVTLGTTTVSKECDILSDFFPLTVVYMEKQYAVGKIPGGFIKREGRPTDAATLCARMIDRPMRPLFPEDFRNKVDVVNEILSVDQDNTPEMTALFASSLAVCISEIPFNGPVAGVKVGRVNGELIINPTVEQAEQSDIELTVAGTKDAVNMVESGSKEVSEDDMLDAIMFGHEAIKELIEFQEEIIKEVGKEKMVYEVLDIETSLREEVEAMAKKEMLESIKIVDKLERNEAVERLKEEWDNFKKEFNFGEYSVEFQEMKKLLEKQSKELKFYELQKEKSKTTKEKQNEAVAALKSQIEELISLNKDLEQKNSELVKENDTLEEKVRNLKSKFDDQYHSLLRVENNYKTLQASNIKKTESLNRVIQYQSETISAQLKEIQELKRDRKEYDPKLTVNGVEDFAAKINFIYNYTLEERAKKYTLDLKDVLDNI